MTPSECRGMNWKRQPPSSLPFSALAWRYGGVALKQSDIERKVEWYCMYTFLRGPDKDRRGYSVSTTTDLAKLRAQVVEHNANPNRNETLEIWRREITEQPEVD